MQEVTHAGGWLQIGATDGGDFRLTPLSAHLKVRPVRLRSRPGSAEGPGPFHPRASAGPADLRPHWTEAPGPDARRASLTAGQGRSGSPRPNARAPDAAARGRGDSWGWREGHLPVPEGALHPRCWRQPSQVSLRPRNTGRAEWTIAGRPVGGTVPPPCPAHLSTSQKAPICDKTTVLTLTLELQGLRASDPTPACYAHSKGCTGCWGSHLPAACDGAVAGPALHHPTSQRGGAGPGPRTPSCQGQGRPQRAPVGQSAAHGPRAWRA